MEKSRCFLGILASLFVFVFAGGAAFAAGYSCPEDKQYTSCNENYYMNEVGSPGNACLECGAYATSAGGTATACTCNTGYSADGTANGSKTTTGDCKIINVTCAAGQYLPAKTTACETCPEGSYCAGGSFNYNANEDQGKSGCPSGYTSDEGKATKDTECYINVADGKYLVTAKQTTIQDCAAGTFKAAHKVNYGSTSTCGVCADNTYSDAGAKSCIACATENGYGNSGTSATNHAGVASCKVTCPAGEYVATAGAGCVSVGGGYWGAGETVAQDATGTRNQCPADYRDGAAATSESECVGEFTRNGVQNDPSLPANCSDMTLGTCSPESCQYTKKYGTSGNGAIVSDCDSVEELSCTKPITQLTASEDHRVNGVTSCPACPRDYPNSDGGTGDVTQCYSDSKTRDWNGRKVDGSVPANCNSATWGDCPADEMESCTYVAYANSAGTGDGAIKSGCSTNNATCTRVVSTVTADSGYYDAGTTCTACSSVGDGTYTLSDVDNEGGNTKCYKTCTRQCDQQQCPANATCTHGTQTTSGRQYYGDTCNAAQSTCTLEFTCNAGYKKNSSGTACVAETYTITYNNGGGTGADESQNVTYLAQFTTKPATTFVRPGYTFKSWGDPFPNPNSQYQYNKTSNTTLTAQWNACAANPTTGEGTCDCGDGNYPNGSGCSNCVVQCTGVTGYTLGSYNVCESETDGLCYRACATSDVANSSAVSGTGVFKNGTVDCEATACKENFYLSGRGCAACVPNATCPGGDEPFKCDTGFHLSDDGTSCERNDITITLNKNGGTGTVNGTGGTANATFVCKYGAPCTLPDGDGLTRTNYEFTGWGTTPDCKSGTFQETFTAAATRYACWSQTVTQCQLGKYYNGSEHVTCPDNMFCPGSGSVAMGTAGCGTTCPDGGKTNGGATSNTQCFVTCPVKSIDNGTITADSSTVNFDGEDYPTCTYTVNCNAGYLATNQGSANPTCEPCSDGVVCPGGTDDSTPEKCEAGDYCEDGIAHECPAGGTSDAGAGAITDCYNPCTETISVDHATSVKSDGKKNYDGAKYPACTYTVVCETDYTASGNGTASPSCLFGGDCPAGHYCPTGGGEPQQCPMYGEVEGVAADAGATEATDCYVPCSRAGDITGGELTSNAASTGDKSYWNGSSYTTCTYTANCDPGYVAANQGTANATCNMCEAGVNCPGGTEGGEPDECPEGSYCEEGKGPQKCPGNGTSLAGAESATDCFITCSGSSITGGTLTPVNNQENWNGNAYPACAYTATCDAGYIAQNQGTASASCRECGAGDYCPGGTEGGEPDECPEGSYCEEGKGPQECPGDGTSEAGAGSITECFVTCPATKPVNNAVGGVANSTGPAYYNGSAYNQCTYDVECEENYVASGNGTANPVCEFGDPSQCPEDHYCPGDGSVHECPDGGKSDAGATSVTQCYKIFDPYDGFKNGVASAKCNYQTGSQKYDYCSIQEVKSCDAGYFYRYQNAFLCESVESGYYSPAGDVDQTACPVGDNVESEQNAASYTQCFTTCDLSTADVPHSASVAATENTVYGISASEYAACEYSITCETGYTAQDNKSENPSCAANEYVVTLDKNGGSGSTPATVTCTFDAGCDLPASSGLSRPGYKNESKWCVGQNGTGPCYFAGQHTDVNISANGTATTLYAMWSPNVYTVNLDHQDATTDGAPDTAYLKYATGWFSNDGATVALRNLTTVPAKTGYEFVGYYSATSGGTQIINAAGAFQTNESALTFTTTEPATIYARWSAGLTHCDAGTYYTGTGTECAPCTANHYCEGGNFETDSGVAEGETACPNNGLSVAGSTSAAACYKTKLDYTATHGSGTQTCDWDVDQGSYSAKCRDIVIGMCDAGYWLAEADATDCAAVEQGNYSGDGELERHACPNAGSTESDTAATVQECFKTGMAYTATNGSGTQRCFYSSGEGSAAIYARECDSQKIEKCRAGYWLADADDIDCSEVGNNYYSEIDDTARHECPAGGKTDTTTAESILLCNKDGRPYVADHGAGEQMCYYTSGEGDDALYSSSCEDITMTSCDAGYYYDALLPTDCTAVGKGYYSPAVDMTRYQCLNGGTTQTATSASAEACYLDGIACDIENGVGEQTCNFNEADDDYTLNCQTCTVVTCNEGYSQVGNTCVNCPAGSVCDEGVQKTCAELTDGQYTMSDAGTDDVAMCYRNCALAANAAAMDGRDYYGAPDTCEITRCAAGYTLDNGQCVECPEGSFCDGETDPSNPGDDAKSCADLGNGDWALSLPGAKDEGDCYQMCEPYEVVNGTAVPVEEKAFYPNECEYEGRSTTGNPCEIIDGVCVETSCIGGFEMIDGVCEPCYRENAISYDKNAVGCQVAECVLGYHPNGDRCEYDIQECALPNAEYAERKWDFAKKAFGDCTVKKCEDGYHIVNNSCVSDVQPCNVENGAGFKEWDHDIDDWGECIAVKCNPGYTSDPSLTNERTKQCGECKNKYSVLGKLAVSSYVEECEIAACLYQGELYNLEYNECVPICPISEYEDETGTMVWDESRKKCVRTCKEGYTMW